MIEVRAVYDIGGPFTVWPYSKLVFSGKEIQVRMENLETEPLVVTIVVINPDASEIMELLLVTDAVRRHLKTWTENPAIHLRIPYWPYARQDRVCAPGEAFSLEVMTTLVNAAHFTSVEVWDVHSHVTSDKLDRCITIPADILIPSNAFGNDIIVAPDKGAVERAKWVANRFSKPLVLAEKDRDPNTGRITRTYVNADYMRHPDNDRTEVILKNEMNGENFQVRDADFFIIDDICDGGATFIELAKVLRPLTTGKIKLWVTHGIFFKGFGVFEGLIDEIYTANCFRTDVPDFVHVGCNGNNDRL